MPQDQIDLLTELRTVASLPPILFGVAFAKEIEPKLVGIKEGGRLKYLLWNGCSEPKGAVRGKVWTPGITSDGVYNMFFIYLVSAHDCLSPRRACETAVVYTRRGSTDGLSSVLQ